MDKIEYRAVIKFFTKESIAPKDINDRLRAVYGELAPSYTRVKEWAKQFKWGRESLEDDPHTGRPVEATAPDVVEKLDHLVHENSRMSKKVLAAMFDISTGSVFNILHEKLHMRKVCSRWIPRTLNRAQKEERITAAHMAPSDYFLFPNTEKYLKGKQYESEEEISNDFFNVWEDRDAKWFEGGIKALKHRYESVIRVHGDYFE
ncbi:protein GVQW3-like [Contarinia nasturtii]|uniref:protein GVQW3-like n=1 Tax=Contarinia nasturtii TaxID=265458 RepID=UPI0012D402EE|nr:protein GVQW3-like [Contarinia nasturtii]